MIKKISLAICVSLFCIGEQYAQAPTYTYTGKPRFQILTKRNNIVLGIINVELFPNIAPKHTRNFDSLVSTSFYDTTAFHRVIPGFVIQGGDPNSRHGPTNTWGYGQVGQPMVMAEFSAAKHVRGILSAARSSNINSATSQFFICHANTPNLDGNYSIYGRVTSGMNFVDTIANAPKNTNNLPNVKIEMFVTYIGSNDTVPNPPQLTFPANDSIKVDTLTMTYLKWLPRSDGIIYHVDVSTDSTFATVTHSTNTGNLLYGVPAGLISNTKYYWRVNNNNGGHFSPWSPVWHFKTASPDYVGIRENRLSASEVMVFPNPGNGKFNFSNVQKGSNVQVFDLGGKLLLETIAKESSVQIDLEGKEKGVYTYRITDPGKAAIQGKLIIR
jgi:peptidyl-prolyl cis-trans isomerase B (cyclophilin B)